MKHYRFFVTVSIFIFVGMAFTLRAESDLPKVLIIGDSISIGYTKPTRELLKGKAEVYRPMTPDGKEAVNCGDTVMGLEGIDQWLAIQPKWDVIHFNWGLWDLCYRNPPSKGKGGNADKKNGAVSIPLDEYAANLEKLIQKMEATGAKLIWATTSVVPEGEPGRIVGDEIKYNDTAAKIMKKHGIVTDDIWALTKSFKQEMFLKTGDVHYNKDGNQQLAKQVADSIIQCFQKKPIKNLQANSLEKSQEEFWDIQSDTWVATDGLGRLIPDVSKAGLPKEDKTIGMFYFIWHGSHGERGPFDISKILEKDPDAVHHPTSPPWGPEKAMYYWGEPLFNYYVAGDDFVIRKHAQMLSDAGVDVLIFDVTNNHTYPEAYRAVCRVFSEMRKQGNKTPQIAFMTSFSRADKTETTLWKDLYSKGDYSDLWFRWKGKPLMMANPEFIMSEKQEYVFPDSKLVHEQVKKDAPLGQTFTVNRPLKKVAIRVPTWGKKTDSAVDMTLYCLDNEKLPGKKVLSKRFTNINDNDWLPLQAEKPLPAGRYYLEQSLVSGTAGWWSVAESDLIPGGQSFVAGKPQEGTRMIRMTRVPEDPVVDPLLEFFTFRAPFSNFFDAPVKPDYWGWLQSYPQHGFYSQGNEPGADGRLKKVEQVPVSISQHINIEGTVCTVFSNPNTRGRSFHQGKMPPPEQRDFTGKNFAEQWKRAFELDPEFVFITGWNEWIAGRFPRETRWAGSDTQEVNFVDQFDREHSRDIEPMLGGHGDAFYYEMIAYNRKFKGVREVEPVQSQPIIIDGKFDDWKDVSPEFRDTIGDPVKRNFRGWAKDSKYVNQTGRNDIIAAKVSYDEKSETLFFYARANEQIVGEKEKNWMLLYLDIDADHKTGWLGYDYLVEEKTIRKNLQGEYRWEKTEPVKGIVRGSEYEIAIPIKSLGLTSVPKSILFKWADNVQQTGDWSDFTLNGDAAPNDRYNYKAVLTDLSRSQK